MSKGDKTAGSRKAPGSKAALKEQIQQLERQLSDAKGLRTGEPAPQRSEPVRWPPDRSAPQDPEGGAPSLPSGTDAPARNIPAGDFPDGGETDDGDGQDSAEREEQKLNAIIETGSVTKSNGKYTIHCLTIIGQIEGHYILPAQNKTTKYEHVIPQLVAIEQEPSIEGLLIVLNTVGGDVEAGLAIAELVAGMSKPTVSLVLGGGHSIGVPLACSAKTSFIAPSATMTVHPVRMSGLVLGVPQTLSYFDKMQERIVRFVTDNSRITAKRFRELMMTTGELVTDVGMVLDGENAVQEGLIDHLGSLSDAVHCLYQQIDHYKAEQAADASAETGKSAKESSRRKKRAKGESSKERSGNRSDGSYGPVPNGGSLPAAGQAGGREC